MTDAPGVSSNRPHKGQVWWDRLGLLFTALLIWQGFAWAIGDPLTLSGPVETLYEIGRLAQTQVFWANASSTAGAFFVSALLSIFGGLFLGILVGNLRLAAAVLEPILISLYSLPKIIFFPVILLIFGISTSGKVTLGVMHGIVPVMIFTVGAIRTIPPIFERSGRTMGLSSIQRVRMILIPAALPEILTGMRIGMSLTLLGVLVGELFAARSGLGTQLRKAMEMADGQEIMALAMVLFAVAIALNGAFMFATGRYSTGRLNDAT